jgi:hypothetical protein
MTSILKVDNLQDSSGSGTPYIKGAVLQVKQTLYTDQFNKTTTAEEDITGFNVSITPKSTSSKILIQVHMVVSSGQNTGSGFTLKRGTTAIGVGKDEGSRTRAGWAFDGGNSDNNRATTISYQFLDSPNTTSATTYKVTVFKHSTTAFNINRNGTAGGQFYDDNYASTITATEIGG